MKKNTKKKLALNTKVIAEQNQKLIQGGLAHPRTFVEWTCVYSDAGVCP